MGTRLAEETVKHCCVSCMVLNGLTKPTALCLLCMLLQCGKELATCTAAVDLVLVFVCLSLFCRGYHSMHHHDVRGVHLLGSVELYSGRATVCGLCLSTLEAHDDRRDSKASRA